MRFLRLEEVLYLHYQAIRRYGGSAGVRDIGLLHSALERPKMGFGSRALYRTLADKAAALVESLVINHPFVDGNKRVAAYALGMFLRLNRRALKVRRLELSEFILAVARHKLDRTAMRDWIRRHSRPGS